MNSLHFDQCINSIRSQFKAIECCYVAELGAIPSLKNNILVVMSSGFEEEYILDVFVKSDGRLTDVIESSLSGNTHFVLNKDEISQYTPTAILGDRAIVSSKDTIPEIYYYIYNEWKPADEAYKLMKRIGYSPVSGRIEMTAQ